MAKGMLFLAAGNILSSARTKSVDEATGLRSRMPATAGLWIAGLLAITGMPPGGLFVSKLLILRRALEAGRFWLAGVLLFALAVAFAGMTAVGIRMVWKKKVPAQPDLSAAPAPSREAWWSIAAPLALALVVLLLGVSLPPARCPDPGSLGATGGRPMNEMAIRNAVAFGRSDCPLVPVASFRATVLDAVADGARLAALTGVPGAGDSVLLIAVLARDCSSLSAVSTAVRGSYPALTPDCPQAQAFERALAEELGVTPEGHPWLKPLRFPPSRGVACGDFPAWQIGGDEAHEVAVGPVHAGIIEPGHFRFQCRGEEVLHLEISLGYQHRGVLRGLNTCPARRRLHYVETLAGDTTLGHALAYCQAAEALSGTPAPPRAESLRVVALELERIANHIGDLGAMAGDVGFLPTMSYCGRIRGDALNLTAVLCGNRFGRGLTRPGGLAWDIDAEQAASMRSRLATLRRDVTGAVSLLFATPTAVSRFEGTGALSPETAHEMGLVGVAARACGLEMDTRRCYPVGGYVEVAVPFATSAAGDVYGRAWVRWLEIKESLDLADRILGALPGGPVMAPAAAPRQAGAVESWAPDRIVVSLVEGWRGEICHVAVTGADGALARYDVVDPSLHNWMGLAVALRGQQISDFPLCNKSFNLSYCGHDL